MDCISKYNSIYVHGKTNSGKTRNVVKYLKDENYVTSSTNFTWL